ncbi:MAG: dTDP-glucose 4,6-dehydratase [Anaerolineales bacterium]|nr:dTDP-glucose 4,6-dehydratase [Anaerolineales bacterium]
MKNVLVTGGAGFIGSNFIHFLFDKEPEVKVVTLDALTYAGSLENLKDLPDASRHTFIEGDICDREVVEDCIRQHRIDTIIHFAAETHVDRSILGPAPFIQTNVIGTFTLLEAARQFWLDEGGVERQEIRFHHISTDEVYGSLEPDEAAFTEETPYTPNSPYAASKAASDHLVRAYAHTYGLPITITNCSNNYGPRQFPEKFVPLIIFNAQVGKRIPVYGDGRQIRDWLYVDDHCEAIWRVVKDGREGETYNIGGNNQPTNLELVELLCAILDDVLPKSHFAPHKNLITFVADRPGHDRRYAMDISKIGGELGWEPRENLESGLRETVDWYLRNSEWVDSIEKQPSYATWLEANYLNRGEGS